MTKTKTKTHKRRGCLATLLTIVVLALVVGCGLLLFSHGTPEPKENGHQLTILTYNTHMMGWYTKPEQNRVIRYLQGQDADVVFLQEVNVCKSNYYLTFQDLKQSMAQYPYSYYDFKIYDQYRQFGLVIYSKYPLIHKQTVRYTSKGNSSASCDMVVGKDTFRLFNNHLESNQLLPQDLPDNIRHKLTIARAIRHDQVEAVRDAVDRSPYPVIVAGDFNDLPISWTYLRMRGHRLRDAFLCSSWGRMGNTIRKHGFGARIDYILCSRFFHPTSCTIDHVNYSDHYPLRTTLTY